jgi:MFS family permease
MIEKIRLIVGLQAAEILAMTGFSTFASLLVELSRLWHLDPAQAGWIASAYLLGYAVAVPVLVGLTDRVESRFVYASGYVIGFIAGGGFAYLANGFWSAVAFRAMAGMSLAGTYMPGLRILTERLPRRIRIRSVPYYTAMFGIGVSLSFWMSGWIAQRYGW